LLAQYGSQHFWNFLFNQCSEYQQLIIEHLATEVEDKRREEARSEKSEEERRRAKKSEEERRRAKKSEEEEKDRDP